MSFERERGPLRHIDGKSIIGSIVLVAVYLVIAQILKNLGWLDTLETAIAARDNLSLSLAVFYVALVVSLLLPLSSAIVLVLAGLEIFSPGVVFCVGFAAGISSATVSYVIGFFAIRGVLSGGFRQRVLVASGDLEGNLFRSWLAIVLVRALPNPLYDVWGYASGMLRIPFWVYLIATAVGGSVPLALLCFLYAGVLVTPH